MKAARLWLHTQSRCQKASAKSTHFWLPSSRAGLLIWFRKPSISHCRFHQFRDSNILHCSCSCQTASLCYNISSFSFFIIRICLLLNHSPCEWLSLYKKRARELRALLKGKEKMKRNIYKVLKRNFLMVRLSCRLCMMGCYPLDWFYLTTLLWHNHQGIVKVSRKS